MLSELQNGQFYTHSNYLFCIYDIAFCNFYACMAQSLAKLWLTASVC